MEIPKKFQDQLVVVNDEDPGLALPISLNAVVVINYLSVIEGQGRQVFFGEDRGLGRIIAARWLPFGGGQEYRGDSVKSGVTAWAE